MNYVEDIAHFGNLLNLITSGQLPAPIVLTIPKTTLSSNVKSDGNIVVRVTDLLGKPLAKTPNVFLMKASSAYDDTTIYSNQQLNKDSDSEFSFNFFASKPTQGFYYLEFGIQSSSASSIRSTFRTVKVVTSVSVDSVSVDIVDSADKSVLHSATFVFSFLFFLYFTFL